MKIRLSVLTIIALITIVADISGQDIKFERGRYKAILSIVKDDVKNNYYDPTFHGVDLDAKYKVTIQKLDQAASIGQMIGIIAQFLADFEDSHLFFAPPSKANKTEYGFDLRMVGNKCFVFHVDKKSDAEKKGLQIGDEVSEFDGYIPTRQNLWKMHYLYYVLRPKPGVVLTVFKPDGLVKRLDVAAKVTEGKKITDLTESFAINEYIRKSNDEYYKETKQLIYDKLGGVFIWKMPSFSLDPTNVDEIIGRVKKSPALILDLRGNSGGRVDMLLRLIGSVFPNNVKVADEKSRKQTKEIIAKSRGKDAFDGKIIVLIDSGSASASEVFSKVIQLEKRGSIIGDASAGAVMESRFFTGQQGQDVITVFGTSVTIADLIMKDGKSLEKIGVSPDQLILITGRDLAEKRDPVLAAAVQSLGLKLTSEEAGKMFPDIDDSKKNDN